MQEFFVHRKTTFTLVFLNAACPLVLKIKRETKYISGRSVFEHTGGDPAPISASAQGHNRTSGKESKNSRYCESGPEVHKKMNLKWGQT